MTSATGIGARVLRTEDKRFLTGTGRYVDDLPLARATYAYFLRSPHAHAKIKSIDISEAEKNPGVVNIFTGHRAELAPWLASHMDVNGLDLTGLAGPDGAGGDLATECEQAAAENLKRVLRPVRNDWTADPGTDRMTTFLETKTVWHTVGV